ADAQARLSFASSFFEGQTQGSYARGEAFQAHASGGVHGTNGMTSALVGMSSARTPQELVLAVRRLHLLYALSFSVGGIPLVYMGDEIGLGNAAAESDIEAVDGRQLHRPRFDAAAWERRLDPSTPEGLVHQGFLRLTQLRRELPGLDGDVPAQVLPLAHPGVLGISRAGLFYSFGNFTGEAVELDLAQVLGPDAAAWRNVLGDPLQDGRLTLPAWSSAWLTRSVPS
ncbi:MAG TPA: hypothetical protein VLJ19_01730, partial [Variovorax sp.]|nr:hypothetical protein [Variovorax sp.]